MFYMFQAVSAPIMRSSKLHTQHQVYVKLAWHIPDAVCAVFELLMMDGETA